MTNYVRGKTWLAVPFAADIVTDLLERKEAPKGTDEDRTPYIFLPTYYCLSSI